MMEGEKKTREWTWSRLGVHGSAEEHEFKKEDGPILLKKVPEGLVGRYMKELLERVREEERRQEKAREEEERRQEMIMAERVSRSRLWRFWYWLKSWF